MPKSPDARPFRIAFACIKMRFPLQSARAWEGLKFLALGQVKTSVERTIMNGSTFTDTPPALSITAHPCKVIIRGLTSSRLFLSYKGVGLQCAKCPLVTYKSRISVEIYLGRVGGRHTETSQEECQGSRFYPAPISYSARTTPSDRDPLYPPPDSSPPLRSTSPLPTRLQTAQTRTYAPHLPPPSLPYPSRQT